MANDVQFNLLKPIKAPDSMWDKIYNWILTRARLVILIAIILVVIAFFLKIVVDNTEKNLFKQYDAIILDLKALEDNYETDFRTIQSKELEYRKLWNGSSNYSSIIQEIFSYVPNPGSDFTINISGDNVRILGYDSIEDLQELEAKLKDSTTFTDAKISLTQELQDIENKLSRYTLIVVIDSDVLQRLKI